MKLNNYDLTLSLYELKVINKRIDVIDSRVEEGYRNKLMAFDTCMVSASPYIDIRERLKLALHLNLKEYTLNIKDTCQSPIVIDFLLIMTGKELKEELQNDSTSN